jgi:nitroreductase
MLEAARWAPSCFNDQPWRFLVFDGTDAAALSTARDCLVEGNRWARPAPVLLLSVARETFQRNGKPNRHGQHDVGLATENLLLQAEALGLAAHPMAGFDSARARQSFGIPEGFTPMAMIAVGFAAPEASLSPEALQKESAPRTRQPVGEIAFAGRWEAPFAA